MQDTKGASLNLSISRLCAGLAFATLLLPIPLPAAQIETSWIGPAEGGSWTDAANWSDGVPQNTGSDTFIAIIDGAYAITTKRGLDLDELHLRNGTLSLIGDPSSPPFLYPYLKTNLLEIGAGATLSATDSATVRVRESFSNLGKLTLSAGMGEYGGVNVWIEGSIAQMNGTTLAGGTWSISTTLNFTLVGWTDAAIHTIGADASVSLLGESARIRSSSNDLYKSALATLNRVDGTLSLANCNFVTASPELTINGNLIIAGLVTGGKATNLIFSEDSNVYWTFLVSNKYGIVSFGNVGGVDLAGQIHLNLNGLPQADQQYVILHADRINGTFTNAANRDRLEVTVAGEKVGTLLITYTDKAITLSDFQAVPEPVTWLLLALSAVGWAIWKSRKRPI